MKSRDNIAKKLLKPNVGELCAAFIYVGQGESTLFMIPKGDDHISALIDCNLSQKLDAIAVHKLLADLLEDGRYEKGKPVLDYFVNTHPHQDHTSGIKQISEVCHIKNVWHSGHEPRGEHAEAFEELKAVIKSVKKEGGEVCELQGTREVTMLGDAEVNILAPAEYVAQDIEDEDDDTHYNRIHEHCAVLRVSYKECRIMITGDSDKKAWQAHISYHHERLPSDILSASHHGSRTFFKTSEDDDEPFEEHLHEIDPSYLVISAPKQNESPHEHPHDDALTLYKKRVKSNDILHMGKKRDCFILKISQAGIWSINPDGGELVKAYKSDEDNGDDGSAGNKNKRQSAPAIIGTGSTIDRPRRQG